MSKIYSDESYSGTPAKEVPFMRRVTPEGWAYLHKRNASLWLFGSNLPFNPDLTALAPELTDEAKSELTKLGFVRDVEDVEQVDHAP